MSRYLRPLSNAAWRRGRPVLFWPATMGLVAIAGCSSGPSRVTPPSIDASGAAAAAMEMYDKDGDGAIAGAELDAAPALKAAMATLDANKDGKVQEAEIVQRIEAWQASRVGATLITTQVTMDGSPVADATVTFEPEAFLGEGMKTAVGVTGPDGLTLVSIPKEQRGSPDWPPGLQMGFYKVKISKEANGSETIPAKYNANTTLGQQIAIDDPALQSQIVKFKLTAK